MTVMTTIREMTIAEFLAALDAQGVSSRIHLAFICPMCATVQSAHDLIEAGAGSDFDAVQGDIGFSCLGRWTGGGSPRPSPDGSPCNWTLGGLLSLHKLVVVTEDGRRVTHFEPASPEQAKAHEARA